SGRTDDAIAQCRRAVERNPVSAANRAHLALILRAAGRTAESDKEYAEATRLDREWVTGAVLIAWGAATSTHPDLSLFMPRCLAREACEATGYRAPQPVVTLAAVEAADGRFAPAIELLNRVRAEAERTGDTQLAGEIDQHLELYRAGK